MLWHVHYEYFENETYVIESGGCFAWKALQEGGKHSGEEYHSAACSDQLCDVLTEYLSVISIETN